MTSFVRGWQFKFGPTVLDWKFLVYHLDSTNELPIYNIQDYTLLDS